MSFNHHTSYIIHVRYSMFITSSENYNIEEEVLEGVAYGQNSELILYSEGFEEYKKKGRCGADLRNGRFIIKYKDDGRTIIRTDEFGNELLFYYKNGDFWCVSSSFLGLALYLNEKGESLTASKLELAKLFVRTSLFEQPYNDNLVIKEIKLLDTSSEIQITKSKNFSIISRKNNNSMQSKRLFNQIDEFITTSRSTIGSFSKNFEINLELSGGLDSRIVMGLALPYKKSILISSDRNRVNDYLIAKSLSSLFDISFRDKPYLNYGFENTSKKWLLYKLANIGVSRTVAIPNGASGTRFSTMVRLNGGGAETTRAFFNTNCEAYYNLIKRTGFTNEIKSKLLNDLNETLLSRNYTENPSAAMISIYTEYRHRYFAGRAWYYSLFGIVFAPMSTHVFSSILGSSDIEDVFGCSKEEVLNRNLVPLLVLCILNKNLPLIRFDEPHKDFALQDIARVEIIANKFKQQFSSDIEPRCYGHIRSDSVLPEWLKKYKKQYTEIDLSYEDFIYKDISGIEDVRKALEILDNDYCNSILNDIKSKKLEKNDRLACLHLKTILDIVDYIES